MIIKNVIGAWIAITLTGIANLNGYAQKKDLSYPLMEIKSSIHPQSFILYITGDGGWNSFSKNLCHEFSQRGFSIIVLDAKKYFWDAKSPAVFTYDISAIVNQYTNQWHIQKWILLGYSFGADVIPFVLTRIDKEMVIAPRATILLNPSHSTDFEIRLRDMFMTEGQRKYSVNEELQKIEAPLLCIYSNNEQHVFPATKKLVSTKTLPGNHQFNNDIPPLVELILTFIRPLNFN